MRESQTHYEVLGVANNASLDNIKRARNKLALKWHPDHNASKDLVLSQKKIIEINAAFEILSDPMRRADYDRSLREASNQAATFPDRPNPGRNYCANPGIHNSRDVVNEISRCFDGDAIITIARKYGHLVSFEDFDVVFRHLPIHYQEEFFDRFHEGIVNTYVYNQCLAKLPKESRKNLLVRHHKSRRNFDSLFLTTIKLLPETDAVSFLSENLDTINIDKIGHWLNLYSFIDQSRANDEENIRHRKKLLDLISSKITNISLWGFQSAVNTILDSEENLFSGASEKNALLMQLNLLREILEGFLHSYIPKYTSEKIDVLHKIMSCEQIAISTQSAVKELIQDTPFQNKKNRAQQYEKDCSRPQFYKASALIINMPLAFLLASLAVASYFLIGLPLITLIGLPLLIIHSGLEPGRALLPKNFMLDLIQDAPRAIFENFLERLNKNVCSIDIREEDCFFGTPQTIYKHQSSPSDHFVPTGVSTQVKRVKKAALDALQSPKFSMTEEEKTKLKALQHFIFHHAWKTHPRGGVEVGLIDQNEKVIVSKITVPHHIADILDAIENCQNKKVTYKKSIENINQIVSRAKKRQRYSFFRSTDTKEQLIKMSEDGGIQNFTENLPGRWRETTASESLLV